MQALNFYMDSQSVISEGWPGGGSAHPASTWAPPAEIWARPAHCRANAAATI